jgi:hypothetical protein
VRADFQTLVTSGDGVLGKRFSNHLRKRGKTMRLKFHGSGVPMKFADAEPQFEEVRSEIREAYATSGTYKPGVQDVAANERFARASDRRHGYRSALTADQTAGLTPEKKFAMASDARNNIGGRPGARAEDIRRRRSE